MIRYNSILYIYIYTVVSWNRVTSKLSILMGCSLLNQPFWDTPIYGNPHISEKTLKIDQRNVTIDHQPVGEICRHIPSVLKHQMQNWQTLESTIPKQHGHDVQHFWCFRHRKRNISSLFKSMMLKQHFQNKKKRITFQIGPGLMKTTNNSKLVNSASFHQPRAPGPSAAGTARPILSSRRIRFFFSRPFGGVDRSLLFIGGWQIITVQYDIHYSTIWQILLLHYKYYNTLHYKYDKYDRMYV